jgi:outer membrane lipoprotein-sorting protein
MPIVAAYYYVLQTRIYKTNATLRKGRNSIGAIIMKCICQAVFLIIALTVVSDISAQEKKDNKLQQIYEQMDRGAKTFSSFSAKFVQKKYTALLKEFDASEMGEFVYKKVGGQNPMLRMEFTSPAKKILTIKNGFLTIYQPATKEAQLKDLGKNQDVAEYLAIGLGQSPAKLEKTFDISYKGREMVNGKDCNILIFKPKLAKVAAYFSAITVWYRIADAVPVQNRREEPNGDYSLIIFSYEKLNTNIPDTKFDPKLPSDVVKQQF